MTNKMIHRIYGITVGIVAVITGICLILACTYINRQGDHPFTAESVGSAFSAIAVPVYLCVALIIGGFILDSLFPSAREKKPSVKQQEAIANKLYKGADPLLLQNKLRKKRLFFSRLSLLWLAIGSVLFLLYALNGNNFALETISGDMKRAVLWLCVCMMLPFGHAVFAAFYAKKSFPKEIQLLKDNGATLPSSPAPHTQVLAWIRWGICAVAVVLLITGFVFNGTEDVLAKAAAICSECIGLG